MSTVEEYYFPALVLMEAMNFEFIVKAVDPIMLCGDSVDTQYVRIYM